MTKLISLLIKEYETNDLTMEELKELKKLLNLKSAAINSKITG